MGELSLLPVKTRNTSRLFSQFGLPFRTPKHPPSATGLIHPQVAFRVLISMAYSKFALGDGDSDSDWGDLSSECSSDSDDSDDSDCDVFGSGRGVLDITLFPV